MIIPRLQLDPLSLPTDVASSLPVPAAVPAPVARKPKRNVKASLDGEHRRRSYQAYSNERKIEFLTLSQQIGAKRAAEQMKIIWTTAKAWIKRDESLKKSHNSSYADILKCKA